MMGGFTRLFGNRESEKFANSWIDSYGYRYEKAVQKMPHASPVAHLVEMWISHFEYLPQKNAKCLLPEVVERMACLHACIRPPECGVALSLHMLAIEHPQVIAKHPRFEHSYVKLMADVYNLLMKEDFDGLDALFNRQNPNSKKQSPFSTDSVRQWLHELRHLAQD